jgi:hypothetical protein
MPNAMTKTAITLLIAVPLLLAVPRHARAQDWVRAPGHPTLFIRPPIVISRNSMTRSAWFRTFGRREIEGTGRMAREAISHYYAACDRQTIGAGNTVWYDAMRDMIASEYTPAVQREIVPGSVGEVIFQVLCPASPTG